MFQIGGGENKNKNKNKNGFTLMEVLIAISIFAIILSIAITISKSFSNTVDLDNSAKVIGTNIKLAKTRSISALNDTNYGVHFESDQIIVFEGDVFVSGDSANKIINLSDEVEIFDIDLAGGVDIVDSVFNRLTGTTDNYGTVKIRLIKKPSEIKQVVINQEGQVDYVLFQTSSASPITNARHVHYDLGWNIENHETLRLEWTGGFGTIINDIDTAAYFNGSEFDWFGTTDVDGSNQSLRVHGWLDGGTTILCIIRDQTEEHILNVYFYDGATEKKITTYTAGAGGTVSVTPNSFYVWGTTIIK